MKAIINKVICNSLFILTMLVVCPAQAENNHEAERAELRALLVAIEEAINRQDIKTLETVMHDDVVVTFLNGEVARGVPAVRTYFEEKLGGSAAILKSYKTKTSIGNPAKFYGNTAIADGSTKDEFVFADGSTMTVDTLWTATLAKQEKRWKVVQLHFSTNIFDNALLNAAKQSITLFATIASIIGLIIGLILGFFIANKRASK